MNAEKQQMQINQRQLETLAARAVRRCASEVARSLPPKMLEELVENEQKMVELQCQVNDLRSRTSHIIREGTGF